jgi:hypothetical protein
MDGLCFDDMDEFGRELDDPFLELEQDIVHVLFEAFGSNPDALTRGAGLRALLSGPASNLPRAKAQIEGAFAGDDRVVRIKADITSTDERGRYAIALAVTLANGVEISRSYLVDNLGGVRRST